MTFVIFFVCVFVLGIAFLAFMSNAVKTGAATLPIGTVRTFVYTGKSGGLSEQLSKMGMEYHINMMIENGWDVVNQVGLPGHVRLGRTVTGAALTGGLSLLAGGSRTADRVTITYRRVQIPVAVTTEAATGAIRPAQVVTGYCNGCGSSLHSGSRFCSSCGATVEPRSAGNGTVGSATERVAATAGEAECATCRFLNPQDASVCINCGNRLNESIPSAPPLRPSDPETAAPGAGGKANRLVWVCIAAVVVVVIGIVSIAPRTPAPKSEPELKDAESRQSAQQAENAFKNMTPAQHFSAAKSDLHAGASSDEVAEGMKHLDALISTPMEGQAKALRARYKAEKAKADKAAEAAATEAAARQEKENAQVQEAARIAFAKTVEDQMLDQGFNFDVVAVGARHTTLRVTWAPATKVEAHQISQNTEMFENARALGFKRMELTDGFESEWAWKLQ